MGHSKAYYVSMDILAAPLQHDSKQWFDLNMIREGYSLMKCYALTIWLSFV